MATSSNASPLTLVRWKTQTRMRVVTTLALRLVTTLTKVVASRVVHRVVTPTLIQTAVAMKVSASREQS
jgi:hypothetical protein